VASESAGTVHVGVLPSMSRQLLPLLFSDLRVRAPAVLLHINEGFSGELDEHMSSGKLDMAVVYRYGSSVARGEDVLGTVETYLVGRPGLPLLSGG
jgi:LysR family nitrogen assimilation transcriptional regulator